MAHRPAAGAAVVVAVLAALVPAAAQARPPWLTSAKILVPGNPDNQDCRTGVCRHNENTDLVRWRGAIWLVHRTAGSQVLGPNSSLRIYRSPNERENVRPAGRSFRAPGTATSATRPSTSSGSGSTSRRSRACPGFALRDTDAGSISVETQLGRRQRLVDARAPSARSAGASGASCSRGGTYYSAAYQDGDLQVVLYRSTDGAHVDGRPADLRRRRRTPRSRPS